MITGSIETMNNDDIESTPLQIDLFSAALDKNPSYSTLARLYDLVPHYNITTKNTALNDGVKVLLNNFSIGPDTCYLETTPAVISNPTEEKPDGTLICFAGKREELVMAGLKKLAALNPVMKDGALGVPFYLRDLQRTIRSGNKERYNIAQIKESLEILGGVKYKLILPTGKKKKQTWSYNQISETLTTSCLSDQNDDKYLVFFSMLLTQEILDLQTKIYNFDRYKMFTKSLSRALYVRLCIRFVQASESEKYTIKASTLRQFGGLPSVSDMPFDKYRLPVISAFKELIKHGVLKSYELVKTEKIRPEKSKNNRPKTVDEQYELVPTSKFAAEQKKSLAIGNEDAKKLELYNQIDGNVNAAERDILLTNSAEKAKEILNPDENIKEN